MNHRTSLSLACAALLLSCAYAGFALLRNDHIETTDDAYVRADSVMIAPRVAGQIAVVMVEDNQRVETGQLLAQIDDADYRAAHEAALAQVQAAEAEVQNLAASADRQKALIDQASATIRSSQASLAFAAANAERYRNLSRAGAGTHEESQKSEAELLNWTAMVDRDKSARVAAEKGLAVLDAQHQKAVANLAHAQASLRQAALELSYTRILAPNAGMVGHRSVRVGAYVTPGKPLLALVPLDNAYIIANYRETQLQHMSLQQAVDVQVDSFPDRVFTGHIDSIAPATGLSFAAIAPDNATGNFTKITQRIPVKIVLDPQQPGLDHLRVGMSVVTRIDTAQVAP